MCCSGNNKRTTSKATRYTPHGKTIARKYHLGKTLQFAKLDRIRRKCCLPSKMVQMMANTPGTQFPTKNFITVNGKLNRHPKNDPYIAPCVLSGHNQITHEHAAARQKKNHRYRPPAFLDSLWGLEVALSNVTVLARIVQISVGHRGSEFTDILTFY